MQRGFAEYRPAKRRPRLGRNGLFRSARPNAVGWTTVVALCLAGAATGYGISRLAGLPIAAGPVAGAAVVLSALVATDRWQWGRIRTEYSWGGAPEAMRRIASDLTQRGVPVETMTYPDGRVSLSYRQRDRRRVVRELIRLGVRPPRG